MTLYESIQNDIDKTTSATISAIKDLPEGTSRTALIIGAAVHEAEAKALQSTLMVGE